jgi:molecular chaperone GrpE
MPEDRKVRVTDRRRAAGGTAPSSPEGFEGSSEAAPSSPKQSGEASSSDHETGQSGRAYLEDLQRLQAEFENYRKRMVREQTAMAQRASERLVEKLLPVLDHFDAAIAHGEGGKGVLMVYEDLKRVLAEEGLEEIPAEGLPFDPNVHEAFESHEDPDAGEVVVRKVLRNGYRMRDRVLRPAMVVVARPPEPDESAAEG